MRREIGHESAHAVQNRRQLAGQNEELCVELFPASLELGQLVDLRHVQLDLVFVVVVLVFEARLFLAVTRTDTEM